MLEDEDIATPDKIKGWEYLERLGKISGKIYQYWSSYW